ncbi:MAG TPA: amidase [Methylomirabilota bacterium]|jgi:aspartyl-tRNA(Asn)/glutamyl-tRNA(Gln) amidotransferase subunit A
MNATDLCYTPAIEIVRLIRTKALSPVEVTRTVLERIDSVNPRVNAFCTMTAETAMDTARAAEQAVMRGAPLGPLHGVPYSVKDLNFTKGVRTMSGSFIFEHRVPDADAPLVRRLKAAGGVMVGKTTSPEFGWKALGDCPLTGITRNPWNLGMTTGGSSAGAGAAAAAGLGPLAQGSDGAGSIRIPSSFCGVYGFKPSYGRVPNWPLSNNDNSSHNGPMTRTVADAALMLSVMAGPDDWDRTALDAAPDDYVGGLARSLNGVHVAYSPDLDGFAVDPEIATIVRDAVRAFEALGCIVDEVKPGFADTRELIRIMWAAHEAGNRGAFLPQWRERMDPGLVACIEAGRRHSVVDYVQARDRKIQFWDTVRPLFERYEFLLTPSVSVAAFEVGKLNPAHFRQHEWDWFDWASFSYPFNFTGQPAASLPAGFTAAGLPVGLQIVGRRHADLAVLQASAAFESARPWADRRPPLA